MGCCCAMCSSQSQTCNEIVIKACARTFCSFNFDRTTSLKFKIHRAEKMCNFSFLVIIYLEGKNIKKRMLWTEKRCTIRMCCWMLKNFKLHRAWQWSQIGYRSGICEFCNMLLCIFWAISFVATLESTWSRFCKKAITISVFPRVKRLVWTVCGLHQTEP